MKAWAYKDFKVGNLFTAQTGDVDLQQKDVNGKGSYLINSGVEAQGIKGRTDRDAKVFGGNTITVDFWGNAYYRDFEYKMATHNHVFSLSGNVIRNRSVGLYLVSAMAYMRKLFSYNNMGTWTKIKGLSLRLPVTQAGDLDFAFMESRIREMEESRIREMEAYLKVAGFEDCELAEEEKKALSSFSNLEFKEFSIGKLYNKQDIKNPPFDKRRDTRQNPDDTYSIPLVNAKNGDNGVMFYGHKDKFSSIEMSIDIVQNGAVATGNVYPQPQKTGVLWDAYLIKAISHSDTRESLLYMSAAIHKSIKKKFSYECKATWDRVSNENIWLPINSSGSIDYHFMETYIRAIEKLTIQKVKDWRAKEIATTKTLVQSENPVAEIKPQRSYAEWEEDNDVPRMVAEEIIIPGSLEVRLRNTKRDELLTGDLDLVLMYAISPVARTKTETAAKLALGIKEEQLAQETIKAFESVRYIMFHYWKNSEATPFELTAPTRLVNLQDIPEGFLVRQGQGAKQYLLIEYNPNHPAEMGGFDILKTQRKGSSRYLPFVCKIENLK